MVKAELKQIQPFYTLRFLFKKCLNPLKAALAVHFSHKFYLVAYKRSVLPPISVAFGLLGGVETQGFVEMWCSMSCIFCCRVACFVAVLMWVLR